MTEANLYRIVEGIDKAIRWYRAHKPNERTVPVTEDDYFALANSKRLPALGITRTIDGRLMRADFTIRGSE